MPDYARVANFEGDEAALDAIVNEINSSDGPPEGVPAKRIIVLANREQGKISIVIRFGSQADLETGSATLDAMSPPDDASMRRTSVDTFEVVLERDAP
jgi:hypothetical protein